MATIESIVQEIFVLWAENEERLKENAALAARLDTLEKRVAELEKPSPVIPTRGG